MAIGHWQIFSIINRVIVTNNTFSIFYGKHMLLILNNFFLVLQYLSSGSGAEQFIWLLLKCTFSKSHTS